MSLIFPKKEILYAPMLGTLGGGSARGFGRGGGGKIELPGEPDRLFAITEDSAYELDISSTSAFSNNAALQSSNNLRANGNFPATMGDIALDDEGTPWIYTMFSGGLKAAKINNFGVWNETSTGISNCRAMCTLRNGVVIISDNASDQLRSYRLNNNGTFTHLDTYAGGNDTDNVEFMISPPDYSGSSTITDTNNNLGPHTNRSSRLVITSASGSAAHEFSVSDTGTFSYVQGSSGIADGAMTFLPNGYILWAENVGNYKLLNQNLGVVATSAASIVQDIEGIDIGRDGFIYVSQQNYRVERIYLSGSSIYRNTVISGNASATPDYTNSIRCVGDYVYWSGYTNGSSWGQTGRHPQSQNLSASSVVKSPNYSSVWHEQLLSGRPNWANTDEAFIEGVW